MGQAKLAVERLMAAYDAKDPERLVKLYAPGAVITRPGAGTMDAAAYARFFGGFVSALPDFTHELTRVVEDGHAAGYEAVVSGTFTGDLPTPGGTVPGNGNALRLLEAGFLSVDAEGRIVADITYVDQLDMLGQLGLR